jgi:hypothetical protein
MDVSPEKAGSGWIIRDSRIKALKIPDRERFKFMAVNPYVKFIKSQTGSAFNPDTIKFYAIRRKNAVNPIMI